MAEYTFQQRDFEHPSILFKLEDMLKNLIGGSLIYYPYFNTFCLKGNEKVLDFGCGGGAGSKCLATLLNKEGRLTCVDLSPYWTGKAKKRLREFANAEVKCGDIGALDLPEDYFDVVTVMRVIHDISPDKRQDIMTTLSRKLKKGGKFFIRERIGKSHGMPVSEIQALSEKAGLKEIEHKETGSDYIGKFFKVD